MVGDSDQLPPVGAGNVLHDMIASGIIPVVELTEVFRQAMESLIVENAHRIVKGEPPKLGVRDKDFFFMRTDSPFIAAKTVSDLCATRLPRAYGYSPLDDIQVICPSRMGECGTNNINRVMQASLNPPDASKPETNVGATVFRTGDKVMQTRNNYDIEWTGPDGDGTGIFNGDIGILRNVDLRSRMAEIMFDERKAVIPFEALQELELAYAVTVHKSQGNEFPAVIMPIIGVPPRLAYRNLLYTGVTRAKKYLSSSAARVRFTLWRRTTKSQTLFRAQTFSPGERRMKMSALEYISYALFPRRCALCGKVVPPDMPVCDRCEADLEYVKGELCPHCGREKKYCSCSSHRRFLNRRPRRFIIPVPRSVRFMP